MIVPRLAVLAGAIALAGCGANAGSESGTYTVAEVTQAFERGGLPVRELVEGEVPCDETFGPPEPDTDQVSCDVVLVHLRWSGEGPPPGALLVPRDPSGEQSFVVLVYRDPVPPADVAPSLSGQHYANVVIGNVLASVYDDELRQQVEQILDDL